MRDPNRIDKVLAAIGAIWKKYPDMRLGQLIMNVYGDPYYVEDDDLVLGILTYYSKLEKGV